MKPKRQILFRIVTLYLGGFLLINSTVGWYTPLEELMLTAPAFEFLKSLWNINILMPTVKIIEGGAGVLFLLNRKTFQALLLLYPVLFNILCVGMHFFGSVKYSYGMTLSVAVLTWVHRSRLKNLILG